MLYYQCCGLNFGPDMILLMTHLAKKHGVTITTTQERGKEIPREINAFFNAMDKGGIVAPEKKERIETERIIYACVGCGSRCEHSTIDTAPMPQGVKEGVCFSDVCCNDAEWWIMGYVLKKSDSPDLEETTEGVPN